MKTTPGQELVDVLNLLRTHSSTPNSLKTRLNRSGVERTAGLANALGRNCDYYKKSLTKFLIEDYTDIRNLITSLNQTDSAILDLVQQAKKLIKIVEGP